jgi:hypothetical protein
MTIAGVDVDNFGAGFPHELARPVEWTHGNWRTGIRYFVVSRG